MREYNVVVASDENYAAHMATLIASICSNNKDSMIIMHVFDGGITPRTKKKIDEMKTIFSGLEIKYYEFSDAIIEKKLGGSIKKDRSLSTFSRVFIPEVLDSSIMKAVYFDVDAICMASLDELFDTEIGDKCIAGVQDCNFVRAKNAVGLNETDVYINAGMILWNLKACRAKRVVELLVKFVQDHNGNVVAMDQGTINGVLSNDIYRLAPRWNALTPFFQMTLDEIKSFYEMESYYSEAELNEAVKNPGFVHFVPNFTTRPWMENCKHPLKEEYIKYRNMTPFNEYRLSEDNRSVKIKTMGKLFYRLPKRWFIMLFKAISRRKKHD